MSRRMSALMVLVFAFGGALGYLAQPGRGSRPTREQAPPGAILISHPDPTAPAGRRIVRLATIDRAVLKLDADDHLILPPGCWVITLGGQSHYAIPD
jgi:hypothetical protein